MAQPGTQAQATIEDLRLAAGQRSALSDAWRRFTRNTLAVAGVAVVFIFALLAIAAPVVAPHSPTALDLIGQYASPSRTHPLGSDELGRDVLSRILYGGRYDLGLTLVTVAISVAAGTAVGLVAGYFGGWLDSVLMRLIDVMLAFPAFLLALALVAFLGPSLPNIVLVLAIAHLPRYTRLIRGSVLSAKRVEYVEAARSIGASHALIIGRHILPNTIQPIIVYASLDMGVVIIALAGLSFLGVGVQPPTPEWGLMLTTARNNLVTAPWTAFFPGLAISLTVISFNFIGDGLRDALDPRLRR